MASSRNRDATAFRNRGGNRATAKTTLSRGTSRPSTSEGRHESANGYGTKRRSRFCFAGNVSRSGATNTRRDIRSCDQNSTTTANRNGSGRRTYRVRNGNRTAGDRGKDSTCRWTVAWGQDSGGRLRCRGWSLTTTSSRTTTGKVGPYRGRWRSLKNGLSSRASSSGYGSGPDRNFSFLLGILVGGGGATKGGTSRATTSRRSYGPSCEIEGCRGSYDYGAPSPRSSTSRFEVSVTTNATNSATIRSRTRRRSFSAETFLSN